MHILLQCPLVVVALKEPEFDAGVLEPLYSATSPPSTFFPSEMNFNHTNQPQGFFLPPKKPERVISSSLLSDGRTRDLNLHSQRGGFLCNSISGANASPATSLRVQTLLPWWQG